MKFYISWLTKQAQVDPTLPFPAYVTGKSRITPGVVSMVGLVDASCAHAAQSTVLTFYPDALAYSGKWRFCDLKEDSYVINERIIALGALYKEEILGDTDGDPYTVSAARTLRIKKAQEAANLKAQRKGSQRTVVTHERDPILGGWLVRLSCGHEMAMEDRGPGVPVSAICGECPDETELRVQELVVELGRLIAALPDPTNPRSEEIRQFIIAHAHVGDFKKLACTLIVLAEADVMNTKLGKPCPHGVMVEDVPRSVFAPYCACCQLWIGNRISEYCATCER